MPQDQVPGLLSRATEQLEEQFAGLPTFAPEVDKEAIAQVLEAVAERLGDNYPYFHPLYAGQMLKPPHPVARAAYALAMNINPNNHARDGGRASSELEIEAVREIAGMFGWAEFLGHLTSSGTLANLEALWVAGQLAPGKRIVGSEQAHYTHQRISAVLKLDYTGIAADHHGRMSLEALEAELAKGDVGTVVMTLGTTALGAVDPLEEVLGLQSRYGFRVHVDGAYGGARRAGAPGLRSDGPGGFDRHRSAQARAAALRLRLRAVPRSGGRAVLQARFAVYVLHIKAVASGRDQPGVLSRGRCGDGFVGHAAAFAAEAGRRVCLGAQAGPGGRGGAGPASADGPGRALPGFGCGGPGTRYCGVEDGRGGGGTGLAAGAGGFCGLRHARFASGPSTIAGLLV
jgi:hypothetical protein